jgi:hypothetical protein
MVALTGSVQAQVTVEINGQHGISEGACTAINKLFGGFDCTYGGTNLVGTFGGWSGPALGGSYYAVGSVGDSTSYAPVPGDGKLSPQITGSLTITGSGAGATIGGTIVVGAAVRNIATGQATRAVQGWTSITHTLAATPVDSAVANGDGGFTYVIGSRGEPQEICVAPGGACFGAHETGAGTTTGPSNFWGVGGVAGTKPNAGIEAVENLAGITATDTTDQRNIGATTTAVVAGASCVSTDATVPLDCDASAILWIPGGEDPGFDNLVLAIATNAAGDIVSGKAWWEQSYRIEVGGGSGDNSNATGTFTFAGTAPVAPACADFSAGVAQDSQDNAIPTDANCADFSGVVTLSIITPPASGIALVSNGNIIYTPNAGFSGTDTLTYSGTDGVDTDQGVLTIDVEPPVDTTPDPFTFVDLVDQASGVQVVSNAITVAGINAPSPTTVTGGDYSVNNGPFTSAAGTVAAGDSVRVRVTSSVNPGEDTDAVLTIGGVSDTFTVTTIDVVADSNPDQFTFEDQDGVDRDIEIISEPVTITGINVPAEIKVTGGEYSIGCTGSFTSAPGTISNTQTVCLRHTSASTSGTAVTTTLTVGTAPASKSDAFSSATRRSGGSSSMDVLSLGLLCLFTVFGRRRYPTTVLPTMR